MRANSNCSGLYWLRKFIKKKIFAELVSDVLLEEPEEGSEIQELVMSTYISKQKPSGTKMSSSGECDVEGDALRWKGGSY